MTVFAGEGPRCIVDQLVAHARERCAAVRLVPARDAPPEARRSAFDAILVLGPSTPASSPRPAGTASGCCVELARAAELPGAELVRGAGGIAEGMPERAPPARRCRSSAPTASCSSHAGGGAGLFSAIIGGWANGDDRVKPVTRTVRY